jgi:hypothetical protein
MPSIRQAVAAIPVSGRSSAKGIDVRAVAAFALYGVQLPDDPPRLALDRIDADPVDYTADVRRQLAQKRGINDPHAVASIDPDREIERSIIDVESYLDSHKARCPECFPLPDRHGLSPIDAQQKLRRHLREKTQSPEYVARWLGVAGEVLSVIERPDFVERCRAVEGESADEQRLGIIAVVRSIVAKVSSEPLPAKPTPETLEESIRVHREHVGTLQARMEREAPASTGTAHHGPSALIPARAPGERRTRPVRIGEAAEWFRCTPDELRGMIQRGEVGAERLGGPESRTWVFDLDDVVRANPDADADADPQLAGMGRRRNARH